VHGTGRGKVRIGISIDKLSFQPVKAACELIGMNYSSFVNACTGMLAYQLRKSGIHQGLESDPMEIKMVVDEFLNEMRLGCRRE
jgi:hypothetical protein